MTSTRSQVSTMISRYSPDIATLFRKARAEVRALFPRGFELVYDQHNAFGCGYSTTEKSSGVVISVVAYPKWVTVFFFHGARLPDPEGILQGSGSRIRSVRLDPPSVLKSKAVRRLLKLAIAPYKEAFEAAPRLSTRIKSIVKKRMPRRPQATRAVAKSQQAPHSRRNIGREILHGLKELKAGESNTPVVDTGQARSYTRGPLTAVRVVEDFLSASGSGPTSVRRDREWSTVRKPGSAMVARIRKKLT